MQVFIVSILPVLENNRVRICTVLGNNKSAADIAGSAVSVTFINLN